MLGIKIKLEEALKLCSENKLNEAKNIYLELSNSIPNNPELLTNLGTIELHLGHINEGIELIQKSLMIEPNQAHASLNIATALLEINKIDEAINQFKRASVLKNKNSEFFYNFARALRLTNRLEEAQENYSKAILLNPNHYLAFNNRGFIYFLNRQYDLAFDDFNESLRINPNYAEAYFNRGNILFKKKHYAQAIDDYEGAIKLNPNLYEAIYQKARALIQIRDYRTAISELDSYLRIDKNKIEVYLNLGVAYLGLKEYQKALFFFDITLKKNPKSFQALINKGFIFFEQKKYEDAGNIFKIAKSLKNSNPSSYIGLARIYIERDQFDDAIKELKNAIKSCNQIAEVQYNLSMLYLNQKIFREGWKLYEARLDIENYPGDYVIRQKNLNLHDLNFNNKKILIYNEQGLGDQILFMSLISELDAENNSVDVVIDTKLISLFRRSFPDLKFIPKNEKFTEDSYDYAFMSASLGMYLRRAISNFIKHSTGYLIPDPNLTNKLREKLFRKGKLICGISWRSSNENIGSDKSFELVKLLPVLKMKNITFVNLQYGNVAKEIESVVDGNFIKIEQVNAIDKYNNIDGLASLIEACDFVISVSNISAHLSGALNKKTFLLLPHSRGRLWYWHNADERSLWYSSITQFPQKREESWDETIFRLLNKIEGYLNEKIC